MHKHNLRVVLATRKWREVSSHWLDADKAPDCTCRKSIDTIRIRASFLTNSSRGELVGVLLQTTGKEKKNMLRDKPAQTQLSSWVTDSFHFLLPQQPLCRGHGRPGHRRSGHGARSGGSFVRRQKLTCWSLGAERRRWRRSGKKSHILCCSSQSCCESKRQQTLKISWRWTSC